MSRAPQDSTQPAPPVAAVVSTPADTASVATRSPAGPGFWVQLGAFRLREGAQGFQRQVSSELSWLAPLLSVFEDSRVFRLQAGPYPSRDEAAGVAARVREALRLVPMIVERR